MGKEKDLEIVEVDKTIDIDSIKEMAETGKQMLSDMKSGVPGLPIPDEKPLISDEELKGVYDEVLGNLRKDREELDNLVCNFKDMVLNEGDATTSSKEALVNLLKIKIDTADKMSKIADLMTRARGVNTMPRWMAAQQNNTINIGSGTDPNRKLTSEEKRALIERESKKNSKEN